MSTITERPAPGSVVLFLLAYLSIVAFGLAFQSLPPILGAVKAELGLTYAQSGFLVGLFSLPGIFLTIPVGRVADITGPRTVAIGALAAMAGGLAAMAGAGSFLTAAVGRALVGVGGVSLAIVAAQTVSRSYSGPALARAMGLYNTGMPLGTLIALVSFGFLEENFGWRLPLAGLSVACLLLAGMFHFLHPPATRAPVSRVPLRLRASLRSTGLGIWLVALSWLWFNVAGVAWLAFGPLIFLGAGYSPVAAGALAGSLMWGALFISPLVGHLMALGVSKKAIIALGNVTMAAVFFLLPYYPGLVLPLMVGLALGAALPPAPVFAYPSELVGTDNLGLAFGIFSTCLNLGSVFGPWAVGYLREAFGNFEAGFVLMAAASLLAAVSVWPLNGRHSRLPNNRA